MSIAELKAARAEATQQALRMLDVVSARDPHLLDRLRLDPLGTLEALPDVEVEMVDATPGTSCSVAGSYDPDLDPPRLLVTRAVSGRREGFTGLHEYGHHLQQSVDAALGARVLDARHDRYEELACEAFASRVLLPGHLLKPRVPAKGADAETVARFYENSSASRMACCVRALDFLVGGGAVVLLDPTGHVQFAVSSTIYPPAKGSDQSATPLIRKALERPDATLTHDATHIAYRSGHNSAPLYGQACWVDGWVVAVVKSDNVPWKAFAPTRPSAPAARPAPTAYRWVSCETCQESVDTSQAEGTCKRCQQPKCFKGHCRCTAASELTCSRCSYAWHRARFRDPAAVKPVCRDCE